MAAKDTVRVTCPSCGESYEAPAYSVINATANPELKASVRSGELFVQHCPKCGAATLLKYPLLYIEPSENLIIWLSTDDAATEEKARQLFESSEELSGYTARLVSDVGSLIEKVNIFDAGLDDVIIELCKYVVCQERGEELQLKFLRVDGAESEIIFSYPGDGRMEMLAVSLSTYEDCKGIVARNPAIGKLSAGLSKIDSDWVASFTR